MFKQATIGLFTISLVVLSGRDATAGCASIAGVWTCATWIKGSTQGSSTSHTADALKCDPTKKNCPTVTFELRGTVDLGDGGCPFPGADGCGLQGILTCLQKKCADPNNVQCQNSAKTFGHAEEGVLSFTNTTTDCTKKVCNTFKNQATLGLGIDAEFCPAGNPVSDFTATEGIFKTSLCPYGEDSNGMCCNSLGRNGGLCTDGTRAPVDACYKCSLPDNPLPTSGTAYNCVELDTLSSTFTQLGCDAYGKNN